MSLQQAVGFLSEHQRFFILAHISPDGDCLGSALALQRGLIALGKEARCAVDASVFPQRYEMLPGAERFLYGSTPHPLQTGEVLVAVDCASLDRTGCYQGCFEGRESLCIDHHITNPAYGQANYIEDCAATGELIYLVLKALSVPIDKETAACLYTAIATDTGNFAYEAVTKRSFCIMGELREMGLELAKYNQLLFRRSRLAKTLLTAQTVSNMELLCHKRLAIGSLTMAQIHKAGGDGSDCDGIIDVMRDIDSVEVACFLRESSRGVKASLRSKGKVDVAKIAKSFGGGGHVLAAGCGLFGSLQEATEQIRSCLLQAMEVYFHV